MSESEISAGGKTFKENEIVAYELSKGEIREFRVLAASKDSPPGLILENLNNKRSFAIGAAAVATRVKKIPQPDKEEIPKDSPHPGVYGLGSPYSNPNPYADPYSTPPNGGGSYPGRPPRKKGFLGKITDFMKPKGGHTEEESPRFLYEILLLLAIIVHFVDAKYLGFSMSTAAMSYRIIMYVIFCVFVHLILNKGWPVQDSILEMLKISAIPLFIVPLISVILNLLSVPDQIVSTISKIVLLFPIWVFYIAYVRQKLMPLGKGWKWIGNLLFTPSGWVRLYSLYLFIVIIFYFLTAAGAFLTGGVNSGSGFSIPGYSGIPGAENSGFDFEVASQGAKEFFTNSFTKMYSSLNKFFKGASTGFNDLKNQTMGQYYTGQVEQNKELTGVFITDFHVTGKQYDSVPIIAYGYIRARSFVEGVTINASCYAQSLTNKSVVYAGTADPSRLENIYIEDQRGVVCTFDQDINGKGGLPAGRYQIYLILEFNFETWAYKQYYFLDRDYLIYLKISGENPNTKLGIPQKTSTIYTNGPVMIGMDDKIEMPFAISSNNTNYLPIGMTLDDKPMTYGVKGEVTRVNKYTLRLPREFEVKTCTYKDYTSQPDGNVTGYNIYTFNIPPNALVGAYMTLNCNLEIAGDSVKNIIPGANTPAIVSIVGTSTYDYKLSKMISITVEKTPGT